MSTQDDLTPEQRIESDFENGKKVVEFLEAALDSQEETYQVHIQRKEALKFLFQQVVALRDFRLRAPATASDIPTTALPSPV